MGGALDTPIPTYDKQGKSIHFYFHRILYLVIMIIVG
jgi:hypothetical protein